MVTYRSCYLSHIEEPCWVEQIVTCLGPQALVGSGWEGFEKLWDFYTDLDLAHKQDFKLILGRLSERSNLNKEIVEDIRLFSDTIRLVEDS